MRELFTWIMSNIKSLGLLETANYYGGDFASVDFKREGHKYTLTIRLDDAKEETTNGND